MGGSSTITELDQLDAAISSLQRLDTLLLEDAEMGELLVGLARQRSRFEQAVARLTAAFDTRRAYGDDGSKSAAAWLARRTNQPEAACQAQVRHGRRLRITELVDAAYACGEISQEHVQILTSLAVKRSSAEHFAESEAELVCWACELDFPRFIQAVRYWENAANPDGAEQKAQDQHEGRRVHMSETFDGAWVLDGFFDAITGTEVSTALGRIERELFLEDWAEARVIHGDDTRIEHLARTPAQRRADALAEMARRAHAVADGARVPEPLVNVVVDLETLAGRVCELLNRTVVTPGQIAGLLSRADVERIVFGPDSRVIDVGRREHFFRGAPRRAVEVRDRHCTHPGCRVPASCCDVDHIRSYDHGGATNPDNGRLRCTRHHHGATNTTPDQARCRPSRSRKVIRVQRRCNRCAAARPRSLSRTR